MIFDSMKMMYSEIHFFPDIQHKLKYCSLSNNLLASFDAKNHCTITKDEWQFYLKGANIYVAGCKN